MQHKTFFGKTIGTVWDSISGFFKKQWDDADHNALEAVIKITNVLKIACQSQTATFLTDLTKTDLDNEALAIANKWLPVVLADELMLQGINSASTQDEVQAVFGKVLDSFGKFTSDQKEKFYTSVAATMYKVYQEIKSGQKITFGQAASLVEKAFEEWIASNS